jgi:hypothetical protein
MTPNYLQFQQGLSLNEFLRDYGTQAQCEASLEKARWPQDTCAQPVRAEATASSGMARSRPSSATVAIPKLP